MKFQPILCFQNDRRFPENEKATDLIIRLFSLCGAYFTRNKKLLPGVHRNSGFTPSPCNQLVYFEEFNDIRDAIHREKQIKTWKREWKDLSEGWYDPREPELYEKIKAVILNTKPSSRPRHRVPKKTLIVITECANLRKAYPE